MATYYKTYDIELVINKQLFDIDPQNYSFTLIDSIHNILPSATLTIKDESGFFHEYGTFSGNVPIAIDFGLKDESIKEYTEKPL